MELLLVAVGWRVGDFAPRPTTGSLVFNHVVEPPPPQYASGPSQTGATTELRLPNVDAVNRFCQAALGGMPRRASRGAYYMGCYVPLLDKVVLPDPKAWPSRREWDEIREHEWAHARGWRHNDDGRGTDWRASLPPKAAPTA